MSATGTMRDLDQIREHDDSGSSSRLMSIALGGLATACVLFAVGVAVGRESGETRAATREDPLARLDQLAQQDAPATPVTWPERLTGAGALAQTAVAAPTVPGAPATPSVAPTLLGAAAPPAGGPTLVGAPMPAAPLGVRLSASPLSAPGAPGFGAATGIGIDPAAVTPGAPAPAGSEGAFSVQVSSFRSVTAAQQFAQRLRERSHRAFVAPPATAPNGAVWHRVRIGPFMSQREANTYRASFEARERMPTIVVRRDQEPFRSTNAHAPAPPASAAPALQTRLRVPGHAP
jgi:cell division septation protein DedD